MASKRVGTRGNPSYPLHLVVPDLEKLLKEARQKLSSTSEGTHQYTSVSETPSEFIQSSSFSNLPIVEEEKRKKELSILIPEFQNPSQVDNFRVYSNPLSSEDVKEDILNSEQFDYFNPSSSPYTPLTSRIHISQIKVKLPSYSHIQ